jgi:hypothetical protein
MKLPFKYVILTLSLLCFLTSTARASNTVALDCLKTADNSNRGTGGIYDHIRFWIDLDAGTETTQEFMPQPQPPMISSGKAQIAPTAFTWGSWSIDRTQGTAHLYSNNPDAGGRAIIDIAYACNAITAPPPIKF